MSICDELKKQAAQTYAEGIDKSIETAAACFRICAEGLSRFPEDANYPTQDLSLLIACSAVSGGWNSASSVCIACQRTVRRSAAGNDRSRLREYRAQSHVTGADRDADGASGAPVSNA